jgi:hypothetical protein
MVVNIFYLILQAINKIDMKTNFFLILASISILLSSCKDKQDAPQQQQTVENKINDKLFTITLNATVLKDDSFQIYYRDQESGAFDEKSSFFIELKGSNNPQDIVFPFPEDVIPGYIRLDFGTNKEQLPIQINSFKMNYFGKSFEAKGSDFFNYLLVNEFTMKFDKAKSTLTPIITKEGTYDPQTTSEKALYNQIQLLIK